MGHVQGDAHRVGVVVDVQPVTALLAVAIQRQRLIVERVGDEQRNQLLGMLTRAVRVGAAGDHDVHAVRLEVGKAEKVAGRLAAAYGLRGASASSSVR